MASRKHKLEGEDLGEDPPPKRAKIAVDSCVKCGVLLSAVETKESKSVTSSARTMCTKCASEACSECKTKLSSEELKNGDDTCEACARSCSRCGEEDNVLFPRDKYPMVRRGALARVCHFCQKAGEGKEERKLFVTCRKCKGEREFAVGDIIAHYQSEHAGFAIDELPVGYIFCPACPREAAAKAGQVFLPVIGGKVDGNLIAHNRQRHPMGILADRLHDAVQQLQRQSERVRTDWVRRILFKVDTTQAVSAADNAALELLLEAISRLEQAVERLPFA